MNRRFPILFLSILLCCFLLSACSKPAKQEDNPEFNTFLDQSFQTLVSRDGFTLHTTLMHPEEYDIKVSACNRLPDLSEKGMADFYRTLKNMEKELDSYDVKTLSTPQKQVALILKNDLKGAIEEQEKFPYYRSYLSGNDSFTNCKTSFVEYAFRNEEDLKNYNQLLTQLPDYLDQMVSYEVRRQKNGLLPSKSAWNDTVSSLEDFLSIDLDKNIYITSYAGKLEKADFLSDSQKKSYLENNKKLVKNTVLPAYKNTLKALKSNLKASTKMEKISQYPNGSNYYNHLLRYKIGTKYDPEEAIKVLTAALENVQKNLDDLRAANPEIETDASCALPMEMDSQKILESLKKDSFIEFPAIKDVNYTLEDATDILAGTNSLAYYVLSPYDTPNDSKGENRIALSGLSSIELDYFPTLAHEGYPGHLYQVNYAKQHIFHPIQTLLGVKGYDEGWGKYAEFYSYDFMEYANIEEDATAALQNYLRDQKKYNLYLSCLCDLKVNYSGFDKKQLEEFLAHYNYDANVADSIYNYVKTHANNYLYYGLGFLEFDRLLASEQEKSDFSMQAFHENVLRYGSCPFYILSTFLDGNLEAESAK